MFSSFEVPANNLGATGRFYRKQVYLAWQNCRPTLCNKQARWPSAICSRRTCRNYGTSSGARSILRHWHWELPLVNGIKNQYFQWVFSSFIRQRFIVLFSILFPHFSFFHFLRKQLFRYKNSCCCQTLKNWTKNIRHTRCQSRDKLLASRDSTFNVVIVVFNAGFLWLRSK